MKSSSSNPKSSSSKSALNRSTASLADPSEAAKIAAHAASHAKPKCNLFAFILLSQSTI